MPGFIFLDKPEGITSFTAVNRTRRILDTKKAGHTGTLDPMATGVLPIMLGGATRFSDYLPTHDKAYQAEIMLGTVTDTLDITGEILAENKVNVTDSELDEAISAFVGDIKQLPPMYSAVSKNGVRLYKLARQGIEIEREARDITIHYIKKLSPLDEHHRFSIEVSCSAGTYIRSLSADIGEKLGCGAVLKKLRRIKANGISIERAYTFEQLEAFAANGELEKHIVPCDKMLEVYPEISVSEKQAIRFENGGELNLDRIKGKKSEGLCRVYSPSGLFLGLGFVKPDEGILAVEKKMVY